MTNKEWLMQNDNLEQALLRVNLAFDRSEVPDCLLDVIIGIPCSDCLSTDGVYDRCYTCIRKWLKKDVIKKKEEE